MSELKILKIYNEDYKKEINYLVHNNEVFDWGLEPSDLQNAINMINHNSNSREAIVNSIINHFIESFSEFIGKKLNLEQINKMIESGCVE